MSINAKQTLIGRLDTGTRVEVPTTYILVDENGNEYTAVLTDEEVKLTATPNDIRSGAVAITEAGVTTGEKEIPAYYVTEGARKIPVGSRFCIRIAKGRHRYSKLQILLCVFNGTISASVSTDRVGIGEHMYTVNSSEPIATIYANDVEDTIELGLTNDSDKPYVIRYFTYKEEQ